MAKTNPFQFLQQVRTETSKVTWPTRRETAITSMMVFMFVIAASLFFLVADFFLKQGVGLILGLGY
jgi:preprotein translocase subunit SecE